jgi:hypothetical protein
MKVPGILKNKYVCYALMALAALNVIGYVTVKAWECLALFALTAYSVHSYCNDKSLAILAALFVSNFVFGCGRVKEGFADAFKEPEDNLDDATQSSTVAANQLQGNPATANTPAAGAAAAAATATATAAAAATALKAKCCDNGDPKSTADQTECADYLTTAQCA